MGQRFPAPVGEAQGWKAGGRISLLALGPVPNDESGKGLEILTSQVWNSKPNLRERVTEEAGHPKQPPQGVCKPWVAAGTSLMGKGQTLFW